MKRSLRSWLWRVPVDQEVDDELAFHLEMRTRELVESGMDPVAAREAARARVGDMARLKRTCVDIGRKRDREMRLTQWIEELGIDVRFALRQLKASPAFALVAVVTLALGIGANSAIFALADVTLLRPLPYPDSERLVMIRERNPARLEYPVSPLALRDWITQSRSFEALGAVGFGAGGGPLLTAPDGTVESAERQIVTSGFFHALGVTPIVGRTFQPQDEGPLPALVVMSEGLWRSRFSADPGVVGSTVRLNGQPRTVIGVVPASVRFTRPASIWTLISDLPPEVNQRPLRFLEVVGRLKEGATLESAQADLAVIADRIARNEPATNKDWGVVVTPLRAGIMGPDLQLTSIFLLGVVGFVLLMCCANVANLLLARAFVREREVAVRAALGAGRGRIVRQLLTESLVLAIVGGVLGLALGSAILRVAPSLIPAGLLPPAAAVAFDGRVVTFCVGASLAVGVLFGLVPAWQATRTSLTTAIASDSRSATRAGGRFRQVLVAGEVAAAVLLLCGAGLLLRTLLVLVSFNPGYRAESDSVLTLDFSVGGERYAKPEPLLQFYENVERDIRALPGVRRAGFASSLPYGTSEMGRRSFDVVGEPVDRDVHGADIAVANPGYFETLGVVIVAGRGFNEHDTLHSAPVCIVNEAFARRYFLDRDPIGARIVQRPAPGAPPGAPKPVIREIVGVARQTKGRPDEPQELMQVFTPLAQFPWGETYLVVQAKAGPPEPLVPAIRAVVARHDPNVPVRRIRTLEDLSHLATAGYRFRAVMAATFAGLALLLAMIGVFGVLAYSVQQRSRELGVRIALGATTRDVVALVFASASWVIVAGAVVGLAAAAALARSISTFLFGVQPFDTATFATVPIVLALTALVATAAPAFRAARIDPVVAFRNE